MTDFQENRRGGVFSKIFNVTRTQKKIFFFFGRAGIFLIGHFKDFLRDFLRDFFLYGATVIVTVIELATGRPAGAVGETWYCTTKCRTIGRMRRKGLQLCFFISI